MTTLTRRDVEHVFEQLRNGKVPERGIETFAVGVEAHRAEIHRQLDMVADGEGSIKFLRGGYGCGKTFMARLALLDAQHRRTESAPNKEGFATSFVVVSDNDLKFHRFDEVYKKVLAELGTSSCPRGALGDILDRWIGRVEEGLLAAGADEDADDFDDKVRERLNDELLMHTKNQAPPDFIRVIQTIFDLKQKGEVREAGALISWLCGSDKVSASAKKAAQIKGEISSADALSYLRGVLEIVKAAGYTGMVIVIDEAETILRMRRDSRHKSLNGIRQIADAAGDFPGLLWLFTGTPEFFDERRGVAGLAPLDDRIRFNKKGDFVNLRQPQLELAPFKADRLRSVALRLRDLFPASNRELLMDRVSNQFIERLVEDVTKGVKGDVGLVPRHFLRDFVDVMDTLEQAPQYVPMEQYGFSPKDLTPEEERRLSEHPAAGAGDDDDDDDGMVPVEDAF